MRRVIGPLAVVSLLMLFLGCGDEADRGGATPGTGGTGASTGGTGGSGGSGGAGGGTASTCTVDPDDSQTRECVMDDHCPCGRHCELGLCVASCFGEEGCADDQACDTFGRCRELDPEGNPLPLAPQAGEFTLEPPAIRLPDASAEGQLVLRATVDVERFRVVARGAEVSCDGSTFVASCELEGLASGESIELAVRRGDSFAPPATVQVFGGARLRESTVTDRPLPVAGQGGAAPALRGLALTSALPEGRYRGVAILRFPGEAEIRAPGVTVDARVFAGAEPRLVLEDEIGFLHPDRTWIGEVEAGEGGATIRFPAVPWLASDAPALDGAAVQLVGTAAPAMVEQTEGGILLTIPMTFDGATAGASPAASWSIQLSRTGDLEAGDTAPAAQAPASLPAESVDLARAATSWEQSFDTAMWGSRQRAYDSGPLAFLPTAPRDGFVPRPEACIAAGHKEAWRRIRDEIFTTSQPRTGIAGLPYMYESLGLLFYGYTSGDIYLTANNGGSMKVDHNGWIENANLDVFAWIPCAIDQDSWSLSHWYDQPSNQTVNCPSSYALQNTQIDRCAEIQQALGCEIIEVESTAAYVSINWSGRMRFDPWWDQLPECTGTVSGTTFSQVTRACVIQDEPPRPAWCGEAGLCDEPFAATGPTGSFLSATTVEQNGDLGCATGRSAAPDVESTSSTIRTLGEACRAALDRLAAPPPESPASVAALYQDDECLDTARFFLGLAHSSMAARAAGLGEGVDETRSSALAHRLLQQWVSIHALLAREASEVAGVEDAIRQGEGGDATLPSLEESLAASIRGWDLLLHPRFGTVLSGLSGDVVYNPDYRDRVGGVTNEPHHVQPLGLPVTMFEALRLQLDLADAVLEKQHRAFQPLDEANPAVGLVRRAAVILALGQELHERALAHADLLSLDRPSWSPRFEEEWAQVHGALRRVVSRMNAMASGENPIGIEDTDLPLYFLDAESPSSRFSAISDYLLGENALSTSWAPRTVESAEGALVDLRTAWIGRRDRMLTRERDDLAVAFLAADVGEQILNLCGTPDGYVIPGRGSAEVLDNVAFFNELPTNFDPAICETHPSAPGCQLDPTTCFRTHAAGCGTGSRYPIDSARCVRGTIGEAALTVAALAKEIDIARSEVADLNRAYQIAGQTCRLLAEENSVINEMQSAHDAAMTRLTNAKAAMDSTAAAASAWKDCAAQAGGAAGGVAVGFALSGCVASAVEGAANIASIGIQAEMDNAEREHERMLAATEGQYEVQRCVNDSSMHLVEIGTRTLRVQQAALELQAATEQLENLQATARQAWIDGVGTIDAAVELVTPLSDDFWVDEALTRYRGRMKLARRMSYLAARAVEYELQQSLLARAQVLTAATPTDLATAVQTLREDAATRTPHGGGRPEDLKAVVSLRQALLQIADHAELPETELQLTAVERFRVLLQSSRFAVFDADGRYLGQRIPFHVSPLGTLGLGETQGISLYAEDRCAERLWSINATIHGEELFVGDEPAFVDLQVQKANSFYSRWCQAREDEPFQLASVRPSRNLFREPDGLDVLTGGSSFGLGRGTDGYTRGTIQAAFNVARDRFSEDEYANGASAELAARGLYGDYALFFPASLLSRASGGSRTGGLALDRVEDILLRLDYVSSAN